MNGSSHPDHENCTYARDPCIRVPSEHSGAVRHFHLCFPSLIRRGGVPPGAAVSFARGGMGVSTPILITEKVRFSWEIIKNYATLPGLRPAAGAPRLR